VLFVSQFEWRGIYSMNDAPLYSGQAWFNNYEAIKLMTPGAGGGPLQTELIKMTEMSILKIQSKDTDIKIEPWFAIDPRQELQLERGKALLSINRSFSCFIFSFVRRLWVVLSSHKLSDVYMVSIHAFIDAAPQMFSVLPRQMLTCPDTIRTQQ